MTQYDINKLAVGIQAYQDIMLTSDTFTKVYGANDVVHLEAEATLSYYPKCCHKCGCVNPFKAQQKQNRFYTYMAIKWRILRTVSYTAIR